MSFIGELKRRNVFRVGAAYLVSSWVLIEIADIMFPAFGFPQGALKWLVGALGLGLLPILVFSWAYELTDKGIVRDKGPAQENPQAAATAQRLNQVTIIMILLALAVIVVERFVLPERIAEPQVASQEVQAPADGVRQAAGAVPEPVERTIPTGPSVAVLPFTNMSPDPENEYFADGISEEILNVLASIDGLKVASRTSAFSFKGTNTPIPQIARQLGVAHVLEGSVRRAGNRVRITAQLIDAQNDQHLWSDAYDRDLTDIFAVQEEIAKAISTALEHELGFEPANAVSVSAPTQDLKAYELFLEGRTLFYRRGEALMQARSSLEKAVARDPGFAEAWATLAATLYVLPSYVGDVDPKAATAQATDAAERARALDDSLAMPYSVLGAIADQSDPVRSHELLTAAVERNPNDSTAWLWRGIAGVRAGKISESVEDFRKAQAIDPEVGITNGWLGGALLDAGRFDEAQHFMERSVALGWTAGNWSLAHLAKARGDEDAAARYFRLWFDADRSIWGSDPEVIETVRLMGEAFGSPEKARALATRLRENPSTSGNSGWGSVFLFLGLPDEGIALELDPSLPRDETFMYNSWHPAVRAAVQKPAFLELAEKRGMLRYWQANGFPDRCRLVEAPERHLECGW